MVLWGDDGDVHEEEDEEDDGDGDGDEWWTWYA